MILSHDAARRTDSVFIVGQGYVWVTMLSGSGFQVALGPDLRAPPTPNLR